MTPFDWTVEQFTKNGFAVVPNAISSEDIKALRTIASRMWRGQKFYTMPIKKVLEHTELSTIIFRNQIVDNIKAVLRGDVVFYPNLTVRQAAVSEWHIDEAFRTGTLGGQGEIPSFVQCSIYLQDNSDEYGGGLDVIPESHLIDSVDPRNIGDFIRDLKKRATRINSKAGDLVFWDGRLIHRGTPRLSHREDGAFAIQWAASHHLADGEAYMAHFYKRIRKIGTDDAEFIDGRYREIVNLRFPSDFPEEFVVMAKAARVRIGSNSEAVLSKVIDG